MSALAVAGVDGATAIIAALVGLVGALLAFVLKPGQAQVMSVDVAEGTINVAKGTLDMQVRVTGELEDMLGRMREEIDELRTGLAAVRSELVVVTRERDDLRAKNSSLVLEVDRLKARVRALEHPA